MSGSICLCVASRVITLSITTSSMALDALRVCQRNPFSLGSGGSVGSAYGYVRDRGGIGAHTKVAF
jgi:hypothetical protein